MTRVAVLAVALAFILGFAFLMIGSLAQHGFTAEAIVIGVPSVIVLVILTVGIVGALRNPPR